MRCTASRGRQQGGIFMKANNKKASTRELVTTAMLIALIAALQTFSSVAARIGLFSFALGLFPATIGAVLYGKKKSLLFGAVLGITILATDATAFALYGVNIFATIFIVMLKSVASTWITATVFDLLSKWNRYVSVIVAAILGPIFNTAIFTLGVCIFFKDFFSAFVNNGVPFIIGFILLILGNFVIEIVINITLSPAVLRVADIRKKN